MKKNAKKDLKKNLDKLSKVAQKKVRKGEKIVSKKLNRNKKPDGKSVIVRLAIALALLPVALIAALAVVLGAAAVLMIKEELESTGEKKIDL